MAAAAETQRITLWLLSVLSFVLVMAGFMVYLVLRWRYRKSLPAMALPASESPPAGCIHSPEPAPFSSKRANSWLAVKSNSVHTVQAALSLHDPKPCSWAEGLSGDREQSLFVSPPVSGWILVIGSALPDPAEDVDTCFRFLADLSRKLGHVQYFHSNSVVNHHAWVRADSGRMIRAYAWAGKTLWNQGAPTPAEHILNMKCYDYGEPAAPALFNIAEPGGANADKVHLLAARWSVDPGEIGWRGISRERGIIGEASGLF